jgi:hypothetical protein
MRLHERLHVDTSHHLHLGSLGAGPLVALTHVSQVSKGEPGLSVSPRILTSCHYVPAPTFFKLIAARS